MHSGPVPEWLAHYTVCSDLLFKPHASFFLFGAGRVNNISHGSVRAFTRLLGRIDWVKLVKLAWRRCGECIGGWE